MQFLWHNFPANRGIWKNKTATIQKKGAWSGRQSKQASSRFEKMRQIDLSVARIEGWFHVDILLLGGSGKSEGMVFRIKKDDGTHNRLVLALQAFLRQTETLNEMARAEEQSSQYLARLTHDLRSPLATMNLLVESLRNNAKNPPEVLENLERQIDILEQLTHDITSLETGKNPALSVAYAPVQISRIIEHTLTAFLPHLERKKIQVFFKSDFSLEIQSMEAACIRILNNIIFNAIKFCSSPGKLYLEIKPLEFGVEVHVEDTGPGYAGSPETAFALFRKNIGRAGGGWGIGLASAFEQASKMGGTITITEPVHASGTRFVIYFPDRRDSQQA